MLALSIPEMENLCQQNKSRETSSESNVGDLLGTTQKKISLRSVLKKGEGVIPKSMKGWKGISVVAWVSFC